MAQDFAKKRKAPAKRKKHKASPAPSRIRWFSSGLIVGLLASFAVYLVSLPASPPQGPVAAAPAAAAEPASVEAEPPRPRFDFYTLLPEQTIDVEVEPGAVAPARPARDKIYYLLQAGSFKQASDADRRRAELLLLGLEPRVEESKGDNGRWFRVYIGPFDTHAGMSRARSLTTAQNIDTLLLKRDRI